MRPIQSKEVTAAFTPKATLLTQPVYTPIWLTNPHVPMPEEMGAPFISSLNTQITSGPVIMDARMGSVSAMPIRTE